MSVSFRLALNPADPRARLCFVPRVSLSATRRRPPRGWHAVWEVNCLICDGRGTPLRVITTAANVNVNVNDITQALHLVDGIPSVAGRPGRLRRRPESVLGDKAQGAVARVDDGVVSHELAMNLAYRQASARGPTPEGNTNQLVESSCW